MQQCEPYANCHAAKTVGRCLIIFTKTLGIRVSLSVHSCKLVLSISGDVAGGDLPLTNEPL